jgi:hypothetical protein
MTPRRRPLYVFDLEGTLADVSGCLHALDDREDPGRFDRFWEMACDAPPHAAVLRTMHLLARGLDVEVQVWTGRREGYRARTEAWLLRHAMFPALLQGLRMRPDGDRTPDNELKRAWLRAMPEEDRSRLVAAFEDRLRVAKMWRDEGVACFQVAEGEF